jgi:hypothetical protein
MREHETEPLVDNAGTGSTRSAMRGRYDLIPPAGLRRLAVRYELGAKKHSIDIPVMIDNIGQELVKYCSCEHRLATQTSPITQKDSVETVTNDSLENLTQNTRQDSVKTQRDGWSDTANENALPTIPTATIQGIRAEVFSPSECAILQSTDSHSKMRSGCCENKVECAHAAEEQPEPDGSTSITTIQQERLGGSCADGAIKGLGALEIMQQELQKHSLTCNVQRAKITPLDDSTVRIFIAGERNWQRGQRAWDVYNHIVKHLTDFLDGDRSDDHLAAVAWGAFALMYFTEHCPEMFDDFPGGPATVE